MGLVLAQAAWGCSLSLSTPEQTGLSLVLDCGGAPISAIQFDVTYDTASTSPAVVLSDGTQAASKFVYSADIAPGTTRYVIVGMNADAIADGALAYIAPGPAAIHLATADGASPEGDSVPVLVSDAPLQPLTGVISAVLNAASMLPGPVAPGEALVITGSALAIPDGSGTSVLFNGVPAPVLSASPTEVKAAVPLTVQGPQTRMQIGSSGVLFAQVDLPVTPVSPAIYTQDGSGTGPALAVNWDDSLNTTSNPAAPGSQMALFVTGLGNVDPQQISAVLDGMTLVPVWVGGPSPAMLQVVITVPPDTSAGDVHSIAISAGGTQSPTNTTIAVR